MDLCIQRKRLSESEKSEKVLQVRWYYCIVIAIMETVKFSLSIRRIIFATRTLPIES